MGSEEQSADGDHRSDQSDFAALSGDQAEFAWLVHRYQRRIGDFIGRMGVAEAGVEDCLQEVFLRAWLNRERYNAERAQVLTWLLAIARNAAIDYLRRLRPVDDTALEALTDESDLANPATVHRHQQQIRALHRALMMLPLPDRTTIALKYVSGLSIADAARLCSCSPAAYRTRLHRAIEKLKQQLPANEAE